MRCFPYSITTWQQKSIDQDNDVAMFIRGHKQQLPFFRRCPNHAEPPAATMFSCDMRLVRRPPKLEIMVNGFQPSGIWDLGFNAFLTFQNFNYWSPFQSKILMWFLKQILSWCCGHDIHGLMVWLLPYTIKCIAYIIMSVHIIIKHI